MAKPAKLQPVVVSTNDLPEPMRLAVEKLNETIAKVNEVIDALP
jgi:hypothetical protein